MVNIAKKKKKVPFVCGCITKEQREYEMKV